MTERKAFEENLSTHSDVRRHHKNTSEYANHNVQNDWSVWQTAWQASRKVAFEDAAKVCESEERLGLDDERAYHGTLMAEAIRSLK